MPVVRNPGKPTNGYQGMINKIKQWFLQEEATEESISVDLAAAALMVEVMAADHEWDDVEEQTIRQLMTDTLNLSGPDIDDVLALAKEGVTESHDLYQYTSRINDHFDEDQKYQLMVSLWRVAYADGNVDRYEDHMIRKIGELIYLHHSHFMKAKHEARNEPGE